MNRTEAGEQMPCRLITYKENYKFKDYQSPKSSGKGTLEKGLGAFVKDLKEEFKTLIMFTFGMLSVGMDGPF